MRYLLILVIIFSCNTRDQYYIQKPRALVKIALPLTSTNCFENEFFKSYYSQSSKINIVDSLSYSISYDLYNSNIYFRLQKVVNLDRHMIDFEKMISIHEKKGANIEVKICENKTQSIYGFLCFLYGENIATSAQFILTDSIEYYVSGGLEFNTPIGSDIFLENKIMQSEIFNFVESFRWASIDK